MPLSHFHKQRFGGGKQDGNSDHTPQLDSHNPMPSPRRRTRAMTVSTHIGEPPSRQDASDGDIQDEPPAVPPPAFRMGKVSSEDLTRDGSLTGHQDTLRDTLFRVMLEKWKHNYKTVLDLARAPLVPIPNFYSATACQTTKRTTQSEVGLFDTPRELKYIVFVPHMLDVLQTQAEEMLNDFPVDWETPEHVMFAAHCLSEMAEHLLPGPVLCNEDDVEVWCDHTIFRPSVAFVRLARHWKGRSGNIDPSWAKARISDAVSEQIPSLKPSMCSATHGTIIPDRLFTNGFMLENRRSVSETLATLEIKTPHVWYPELFGDLFRLPPNAAKKSHTMRFCWPKSVSSLKETRDRILVQVWAQMTADEGPTDKVLTEYASLTSHQTNLFFMRANEHPHTLFVSREYGYDHYPVLVMFAVFAAALGLIHAPVLPAPDLREEVLENYPGKAGLILTTCSLPP
ncbi:hypothetical protein OH76DRAFT_1412276 [Lentinus brumalis]|uniref:Uncharacterized protein n=1 Tax=Lentinus brumalis TaxID=2498619 RepID=A0A371CLU0_9APHY|nr:hypothetical protein OH76DRAFT_1412276 [Polyporus brumalis]